MLPVTVVVSMTLGNLPNMAAAGKAADYSKARLVDMRSLKEAQISAREACRCT